MLGIDALTLGSLMTLAAAQAMPVCRADVRPEIKVTPRSLSVKYDYSQSLEQLQRYNSDTVTPENSGLHSYTQGLMHGAIKIVPKVRMKYHTYPDQQMACAWYEQIEVTIEIDPTIMIAREVYNDRCMRDAVIEHELKHVKVDRQVVNSFAQSIGTKLYEQLKALGFKSDVFPLEQVEDVVWHMQQVAFGIVEREYQNLDVERIAMQSAIDTREEYERVAAKCPDFKGGEHFERRLQDSGAAGAEQAVGRAGQSSQTGGRAPQRERRPIHLRR